MSREPPPSPLSSPVGPSPAATTATAATPEPSLLPAQPIPPASLPVDYDNDDPNLEPLNWGIIEDEDGTFALGRGRRSDPSSPPPSAGAIACV